MSGGGIAELMSNSPGFGEEIRDGLLAAAGIIPDSAEYNAFLLAAQTILDDADSINYASRIAQQQNVFAIEAVGNGTAGSGDQTIPNSVATAPLAGTEPFLRLMGTQNLQADAPGHVMLGGDTAARFSVGGHNSFLQPDEATPEMQLQTASFIASQGTAVQVQDNLLLYTP